MLFVMIAGELKSPVRRSISTIFVVLAFCITLVINLYLLWAVMDASGIVRTVEVEVGHGLSCQEAYQQRTIDSYFHPNRRFQSNML